MAQKQSERVLVFEEVRKAQSRLNRIAGVRVLSTRDNALLGALTTWMHVELLEQSVDHVKEEA